VTLAGPIAAYENTSNVEGTFREANEGESKFIVTVLDLRTGRVIHEVPTGRPQPPNPKVIGAGVTTAIVVKTDGAVAWIVETNFKPAEYEVHALDKSGSRVLASGADVALSSLALTSSTLYWTQGGKPFSARLN
jgi:butyrate kinase